MKRTLLSAAAVGLSLPLALLASAGCARPVPSVDGSAVDAAARDLRDAAPECLTTANSTLDGVSLAFPSPRCVFTLAEAAAGISIPYQTVVDRAVTEVVAMPGDAGRCQMVGPSGLFVLERLTGGGQGYCVCDSGRCPPPERKVVTLAAGTYPQTFSWDGRNWNGPSDTGTPKGAPFPAGTYTLEVVAQGVRALAGGDVAFAVRATLNITLVN